MPKIFVVVAAALIGFFVANTCLYVVDQRQYAIVFALGQVEEVRQEPGLYFKLPAPFQNVIFLDKRIQTIDTPEPERFITSEKKNPAASATVRKVTTTRCRFLFEAPTGAGGYSPDPVGAVPL